MKKFMLFFIIAIVIGCSNPITETIKTPTATVSITDIYQSGNYVYVYYDITNTGNCNISYYEVPFTIICLGGYTYKDYDNGNNLLKGKTISDYTMIYTGGYTYYSYVINTLTLYAA
jgi:hypothetical protein